MFANTGLPNLISQAQLEQLGKNVEKVTKRNSEFAELKQEKERVEDENVFLGREMSAKKDSIQELQV